ncbi:MAG: T9SS type A sorting domain-containing protein [Bacteroidales bacterium]|nr:T9SS type A sorting domain-containing protein [Bacteroidales bacterium]
MKQILYTAFFTVLLGFNSFSQSNYTLVTLGLEDIFESGPTEFEAGDIDADGDIDLISVGDHMNPGYTNEQGLMVYKNNGNGTVWTKTMSGGFGYGGIALGDVNNDGDMDVAYGIHHYESNPGIPDFGDQKLEVVLGDGTGYSWTPYDDNLAMQGQVWGMFGCDFADVDNNGLLDLGANSFGSPDGVWIYRNNGNGSWSVFSGATVGNSGHNLIFGDFDNDGYVDFMANNTQFNGQQGQIWRNSGTGQFESMNAGWTVPPTYGYYPRFALADIDQDGAKEIAISYAGYPQVFDYEPGTASWTPMNTGLPGTSIGMLYPALGDMNNDGYIDLLAFTSGEIKIYSGNGAGTWLLSDSIAIAETTCSDMKLADFDHNGSLDIAYWGKNNGANMMRVYLRNGTAPSLGINPVFPQGNEIFCMNSVQFIKWKSAVPGGDSAFVSIAISSTGQAGPYTNIATNIPNSGTYQWTTPVISSTNLYLRFIIQTTNGVDTSFTASAFSIQSCYETLLLPGPITGLAVACPGETVTYTVPAAFGATSYSWTLPIGWSGSSNSNTITVNTGNLSGTISVTAVGATGQSSPESFIVTIIEVDNILSLSGQTLTASNLATSWQWIDCISGLVIPGAYSSNFTATQEGSYAAIIEQNGCIDTSSCYDINLGGNPPVIPGQVIGSYQICQGETIEYSIPVTFGATSYEWTIPTGWTGSSTSNTIVLQAGNTSGYVSVVAIASTGQSQPEEIYITVIELDTTVIISGSLLTASANASSWQWYDCTTNQAISSATNQSYTAEVTGNYAVIIEHNGCVDTSSCHRVFGLSILDLPGQKGFRILPNPTTGIINIQGNSNPDFYVITDIIGNHIITKSNYPKSRNLDVSNLPEGVYFLTLYAGKDKFTFKLIKLDN